MPVNAVLYYGASGETADTYKWHKNDGDLLTYNATQAAEHVTEDACAKLKTDNPNLRIYVIKYRKQLNRKNKVDGSTVGFDYDYIDSCATTEKGTTYVYDVFTNSYKKGKTETADTTPSAAEANLAKALADIASDIKTWAGYKAAQNVK
jgi:hypothetical protein